MYENKLDHLYEMEKFLETQATETNKRKKKTRSRLLNNNQKTYWKKAEDQVGSLVNSTEHLKTYHQSFSDFSKRVQTSEGVEHSQDTVGRI